MPSAFALKSIGTIHDGADVARVHSPAFLVGNGAHLSPRSRTVARESRERPHRGHRRSHAGRTGARVVANGRDRTEHTPDGVSGARRRGYGPVGGLGLDATGIAASSCHADTSSTFFIRATESCRGSARRTRRLSRAGPSIGARLGRMMVETTERIDLFVSAFHYGPNLEVTRGRVGTCAATSSGPVPAPSATVGRPDCRQTEN